MKSIIIYGHRGAARYYPENTMISYEKAIEMGADGIEIDVHKSKDGHLIVCHDEKVDRTTNGSGYIKDLSLQELKNLDAGSWFSDKFKGERIPVLEEVLQFVKEKNVLLNIEIKSGPIFYHDIEEDIVNAIKAYNLEDRIIISSFNHYSLLKIKDIDKGLKTGILYIAGLASPWEYARSVKADAIHPLFMTIDRDVVLSCLENGIQVNPFTVNEEWGLQLMKSFGVTSVITDCPDLANNIL
ncbi:glycerophosphodiester phosphodiesterase [Tissierella sp. MSJ-40]|uniref:Glycerophosphodiester phosphodiesterase n=1 Tax=Tissierella simiarum TaxID=2841534 RepID=A0ABS6E3W4_9FIRM|nr:glycerophosphodiester phosphodiesterase [Tissierella simiarum]MBU5437472.1 glycerophosphodiester phosphodiesterase [Tissierella simiarum]